MVVPVHVGVEHPSLLWLVGAGLVAFLAGLLVNLYRAGHDDAPRRDPLESEDRAE